MKIAFNLLVALLLLTVAPMSSAQVEFGDALYYEKVDPFTDENTSYVVVTGESASTYYDQSGIVWRCFEGGYELYVVTSEYLTNEDRVRVRTRFDKDPPSNWIRWYTSTDGTSAFATEGFIPTFTNAAVKADSVVIGLEDYEGTMYTYTFQLQGVREALDELGCVNFE